MSERKRDEKKEEKDEKEEEKRHEKEEKWRRDRGNAVTWASVLIWGALVILAETTGFADDYDWWAGWAVFFTGAGAILLMASLIRLIIPEYRRPLMGSLILGLVFLGVGLGELVGWKWVWPIVLIAVAITILLTAFVRRR